MVIPRPLRTEWTAPWLLALVLGTPALAQDRAPASDRAVETLPILASVAPIRYPPEARYNKIEGRVMLRVLIDAKGWTQEIAIKEPSEHAFFNEAALITAKHWRYTPGSRDGKPVAMWVTIPIEFKMPEPKQAP
jgi:protein TonB